ncbi:hypothetical protein BWQ96_03248 [Gracilariopsis chorda]|uniref:Uncharacterized protein n=1 Tax=Gracilariopsis chorda TaxID=448386 RepID=A0A2V3J0L7_9FLOR|nr:hypothetical protein BWQ96_03248 [Gracilariopsis chorda]|eukprot:PXF46910.1 hypothetical protein BWQ96_03248 [Gracilariopsis chorda]
MASATFNNRRVRSLIYGLITLCSLVVFGNIAEVCDKNNVCPVRLRGIITIGVLGTVFSLTMCIALLCDIELIAVLELVFAVILFILYSICVGIVSSVRTGIGASNIITTGSLGLGGVTLVGGGLGNIIAVTFSWIAEVLVCIALFMALTCSGGLFPLKSSSKSPDDIERGLADVETPEREYMEKLGSRPLAESPDGSEESPSTPTINEPTPHQQDAKDAANA